MNPIKHILRDGTSFNARIYKCRFCGAKFNNYEDYMDHMRNKEGSN